MEGENHEENDNDQGKRQEDPTKDQARYTGSGTLDIRRSCGALVLPTQCWDISMPSMSSEPRMAFNKTVVLRYRFHLEERGLAPGTINVRMAAVRRLAYEAADSGLLSPEQAIHPSSPPR
jgi:hypothetical protein